MWLRGQCIEIVSSFRAKQFCQEINKIVVEGGRTIISAIVYIKVKKKYECLQFWKSIPLDVCLSLDLDVQGILL